MPVPVPVLVPVPVPVPVPPTNPHVYGKAGRLQCIGPFVFRFVSFRFSFHLGYVFFFISFRFSFAVSFFVCFSVSFSFWFRSHDGGGDVVDDGNNVWMSCRDDTSLEMGGGSGMPIDSVLCCALQIDSYETGGRVGVDGTQWAHRARVLDPSSLP